MNIKTDYWAKPIPDRQYDWTAVLDGYDAGDPIGYGATEADAIKELMEQVAERLNLHDDLDGELTWCGKHGAHYCFECGNAYDQSYGNLDQECPDHMKCMRCRY